MNNFPDSMSDAEQIAMENGQRGSVDDITPKWVDVPITLSVYTYYGDMESAIDDLFTRVNFDVEGISCEAVEPDYVVSMRKALQAARARVRELEERMGGRA